MSQAVEAKAGRSRHPVDEVLPVTKLGIYGFQHVLAFYAGAVIVPILLAKGIGLTDAQLIHLINADLLTCGIASIIQSVGFWKVGVRLPLLQGVTFTAVSPMIAIGLAAGGGTQGLLSIYGSVIVAGLFLFFIAHPPTFEDESGIRDIRGELHTSTLSPPLPARTTRSASSAARAAPPASAIANSG